MPQLQEKGENQINGTMDQTPVSVPTKCPPPPPGISPFGAAEVRSQLSGMKIRPCIPQTLPEPKDEISQSLSQLKTRLEKDGSDPESMTFIVHYQQVTPVLQDGPMCGLVALCMAAPLLGKDIKPTEALSLAQSEHFSKQGELFSVSHMADLAVKLTNCKYELWHGRQVRSEEILMALADNRIILVPYDADGNNEPCLKKGHKAHWAVLSGFIWGIKSSEIIENELLEKDPDVSNLYHIRTPTPISKRCSVASSRKASALVDTLKSCGNEVAYVFAKQGKSAHTKLWSLKDLLASNDNLIEVGNKIESDMENYTIPKEGIRRTLCGKVLVVEKRS